MKANRGKTAKGTERTKQTLNKKTSKSSSAKRPTSLSKSINSKWVWQYNHERVHSGKYCYGKTPVRTFMDSIPLAKEKLLGYDVSDGQPA